MAESMVIDRKLIMNRKGQIVRRLRNNSGGTVNAGAPVIFDTTTTDAFTTTTSQDNVLVAGVCLATVANQGTAEVLWEGFTDLLKVDGTTDIAVGDLITTFTTAGIGAKQSAAAKGGVFAIALEAYTTNDGNGVIDAWVSPTGRTDASGNTLTYGTAGQMAADGVAAANAAGSTNAVSRVDHVHTLTADTPALTLGATNVAGTAGSILSSDATVALFDTTVPGSIAINDTAAVGSAAKAARRDHAHGFLNTAAPADGSLGTANAAGSNNTLSRSDHAHKSILQDDVPIILGTTDAAGTAYRLEYDTAETADALKLGVNTTSRRIIICDYGDMGTDTTLAAASNPELVLYDAAITDWGRFNVDSGGLNIDTASGDAIALQVNATDEVTIDANGIALAAANYIQNNGAAGALRKMLTDVNGNEFLETYGTTNAVNHLTLTNSATGVNVILGSGGTGADANAGITLLANGTGAIVINNGTDPVDLRLMGAQSGYNNNITDVNGANLLAFYPTPSAVNFWRMANTATTVNPEFSVGGTDANIGMNYTAKGTGAHVFDNGTDPVVIKLQGAQAGYNNEFQDVNGNEVFVMQGVASAVNELGTTNAIATANPQLIAQGGDANISITIAPKAAGQLNVAPGTPGTAAAPDLIIGGDIDSGLFGGTNIVAIATAGAEVMRCSAARNVHIANSTAAATQAGDKVLYFTNAGTNPSGLITNGAAIYCTAGELYTLDAAGNAVLQSPHSPDGDFIIHSYSPKKGRTVRVHLEKLLRRLTEDPRYAEFIEERAGHRYNNEW